MDIFSENLYEAMIYAYGKVIASYGGSFAEEFRKKAAPILRDVLGNSLGASISFEDQAPTADSDDEEIQEILHRFSLDREEFCRGCDAVGCTGILGHNAFKLLHLDGIDVSHFYPFIAIAQSEAPDGTPSLQRCVRFPSLELEHADGPERKNSMLSICSFCKKVKTEHDRWIEIERFLAKYEKLVCTHGICTTCFDEHYSEYGITDNNRTRYYASSNNLVSARVDFDRQLTTVHLEHGARISNLISVIDDICYGNELITENLIFAYHRPETLDLGKFIHDLNYIFNRLAAIRGDHAHELKRLGFVYSQALPARDDIAVRVSALFESLGLDISFGTFDGIREAILWTHE